MHVPFGVSLDSPWLACSVALAMVLPTNARGQTLMLPPSAAIIADGNSFAPGLLSPSLSWQSVHDTAAFTSQGIVGPIRITALEWRADANQSNWAGLFDEVTLTIGRAAVDHLQITGALAANLIGTPLVHVEHLVRVASCTAGAFTTRIVLPGLGFEYDPTLGNDLVIGVATTVFTGSGSIGPVSPCRIDGVSGSAAMGSMAGQNQPPSPNRSPVVRLTYVPSGGAISGKLGSACSDNSG